MYVVTCGVYISEELIGHVCHFAEYGQVAGPLDLQAVGPGLAQQIILALFNMYVYVDVCICRCMHMSMFVCMYVCMYV